MMATIVTVGPLQPPTYTTNTFCCNLHSNWTQQFNFESFKTIRIYINLAYLGTEQNMTEIVPFSLSVILLYIEL